MLSVDTEHENLICIEAAKSSLANPKIKFNQYHIMENYLKIEKSKLIEVYCTGTKDVKTCIESLFPEVINPMEYIKTWEDVMQATGLGENEYKAICDALHNSCLSHKEAVCAIAHFKIMCIVRALNNGWTLTKEAEKRQEGYGIYWLKRDGVRGDVDFQAGSYCAPGYVCAGNSFGDSNWGIVPRLSFKTKALAEYAVTQFPDIWREYYNNYEQNKDEEETC